MEEDYKKPHIIIDNGTGYCKAGFTGEALPRADFPTCIGYPKYENSVSDGDIKEFYVGGKAMGKCNSLKINNPIVRGDIKNFDDMEKIWGHIFFTELRIDPREHNVLLTQPPTNLKIFKEKTVQVMFETFDVPCLYLADQGYLSLLGAGIYTGIALDSGEGVTHAFPVLDGFPISNNIIRLDIGGKDLDEYMIKLLGEIGFRLSLTHSDMEIAKNIKEKSCYVELDFEEGLKCVEPYNYELPDGIHITVKEERIRCPEALFKPFMADKDVNDIAEICYDSIRKFDFDIRKDLYHNIILSGGNTMFEGFPERLTKEIRSLAPETMKEKVKVIASPERKYYNWFGGSILSSISQEWITKIDYEEYGSTIVHRKDLKTR